MTLTAIVPTHNSSKTLRNCLNSLKWCKNILIIDDYSTDDTLKIAMQYTRNIHKHHLDNNFAKHRNFALTKVKTLWTLFIDPDEIVTKKLAQEIKQKIKTTNNNGFYIKRHDIFLGKLLSHGEIGQTRLRILGKTKAGKWTRAVHEQWELKGELETLNNPLIHDRQLTISRFIDRLNFYTDIDKKSLLAENKPFTYTDLLKPFGKFIQNYILRLGFLDGFQGFIMAFLMSLYSLTIRIKLWEENHV